MLASLNLAHSYHRQSIYFVCVFLCMNLFCVSANAQNHRISIDVIPTIRVRSTAMNFFNFKGIKTNIYVPYDYERSLQSVSLGTKLAVHISNDLVLSYTPFIRYGYKYSTLQWNTDSSRIHRMDRRGFILDQQISISKNINSRSWYCPSSISLGWGIVNSGIKYFLVNGPINQSIRVETNTIDLGANFDSKNKKWVYSINSHYLYGGFANNRADKMIMYSATAGFKLVSSDKQQVSK